MLQGQTCPAAARFEAVRDLCRLGVFVADPRIAEQLGRAHFQHFTFDEAPPHSVRLAVQLVASAHDGREAFGAHAPEHHQYRIGQGAPNFGRRVRVVTNHANAGHRLRRFFLDGGA